MKVGSIFESNNVMDETIFIGRGEMLEMREGII